MVQFDPLSAFIALAAVAVSIWAIVKANAASKKANVAAEDSARAAERSAAAAESANEVSLIERARAIERTDVEWDVDRVGGVARLRNIGTTPARNVHAVARVGTHPPVEGHSSETLPDHSLDLDLAAFTRADQKGKQATMESMRRAGYGYFPGPTECRIRVTWETSAGTPSVVALSTEL